MSNCISFADLLIIIGWMDGQNVCATVAASVESAATAAAAAAALTVILSAAAPA